MAVDVNDYDLFMDIHHAAVRRNAADLAHAALIKVRFVKLVKVIDRQPLYQQIELLCAMCLTSHI